MQRRLQPLKSTSIRCAPKVSNVRIGLNLLYLIPGIVGGTETYARGLINGLRAIGAGYDFILFLNRESEDLISDDYPGFTKVVCPVCASNRKNRYAFEQFRLKKYLEQYKIDLLHSLAYTSPLSLTCPTVVTVHDLNFKAFGNSMPFSRRFALSLIVRQAVLRANMVVTVSQFSKQQIIRQYPVARDKVKVIYHGSDHFDHYLQADEKHTSSIRSRFQDRQEPYIVAFSSKSVNKNISRLIEAFMEARRAFALEHHLVLIGHKFPPARALEKDEFKHAVHWTGYLKDDDVFDVIRHADFMVFPSFYEGFGLPVLEAMAAGVPVTCSKTASLPEVAGDAAIYFDPYSVKDMAAKISMLAADRKLKNHLREKGFLNNRRFSWQKTATETLALYNGILHYDFPLENTSYAVLD